MQYAVEKHPIEMVYNIQNIIKNITFLCQLNLLEETQITTRHIIDDFLQCYIILLHYTHMNSA